jgi:hypothetical protein
MDQPLSKENVIVRLFYLGNSSVAGCPPFWRKEFRTLSNAAEFTKHGMDFMATRFKPSPGKSFDILNLSYRILYLKIQRDD